MSTSSQHRPKRPSDGTQQKNPEWNVHRVQSNLLSSQKNCAYTNHHCDRPRRENSQFCLEHFAHDRDEHIYRPCVYVYENTNRQCNAAATRTVNNKLGYCMEHLRKNINTKYQARKVPVKESTEKILNGLAHHVKVQDVRKRGYMEVDDADVALSCDPFVDVDAVKINDNRHRTLDYASSSDTDTEVASYNNVWHSQNLDLSDNESIDSDREDSLKHAEIYTAEEVCSQTKNKLVRLKKLYEDQFRYLQLKLRQQRYKYLHELKNEKAKYSSIHNQVKQNPSEYVLYQKLKALNGYQKRVGIDAILQKRVNETRTKLSEGPLYRQPQYAKCMFTEGGVKCVNRVVPLAKHCMKHILCDTQQVLFRACNVTRGDADFMCHEPVPDIFPNQTCVYHTDFPSLKCYTNVKADEGSDGGETTDTADSTKKYEELSNHSPVSERKERLRRTFFERGETNQTINESFGQLTDVIDSPGDQRMDAENTQAQDDMVFDSEIVDFTVDGDEVIVDNDG